MAIVTVVCVVLHRKKRRRLRLISVDVNDTGPDYNNAPLISYRNDIELGEVDSSNVHCRQLWL